ncbi:protocatechuate 3,4-dioxygenase [Paludisphaera borealis]|uniref:Protocatechuate 3,4-dioxygenase beta chain n=1 Tax=Paludisphaera borealis TaxID=1387353 RepID=A0A1U7CRJ9_9BACT|nr:protocatechuate 3,4-dioxygenase [Paludisphaera borealis]APW61565.1 Protocatechuate 3,4-dioxygenase beta chain [Paludisphaera borealis]
MHRFESIDRPTHRRAFLGSLALGASAFAARGAFADELMRTPSQTEGPFYPDKLPLDTDNDLIVVNDNLTSAVGEITHLTGRLLDSKGEPIRNALIEIWQVDANGAYLHTKDPAHGKFNANFQGFGRFLTGSTGEYYFRTIKPVAYTGRAPHIHVKVRKGRKELLTTQFYIKGSPENERDGIYKSLRDPKDRDALTLAFTPVEGSKIGELSARGDLVIGVTPEA